MIKLYIPLLFLLLSVVNCVVNCDHTKEYKTDLESYFLSEEDCDIIKNIFDSSNFTVICDTEEFKCHGTEVETSILKYGRIFEIDLYSIEEIPNNINLTMLPNHLNKLSFDGSNLFGEFIFNRKGVDFNVYGCKVKTNETYNILDCRSPNTNAGLKSLFMFILSIGLYFFIKNVWLSLGMILIVIVY